VGRLALHYVEENPDEVVAAREDKAEAVLVHAKGKYELKDAHGVPCPYKTKGEERSLDYARDDKLGERLVDEG
jgi:hypothetical protein